jgi:hydrogenase maturation protease
VGRRLARELPRLSPPHPVEIREFVGSPLDLLSELDGYRELVLIDAIVTRRMAVGDVALFREEEIVEFAKAQYVHGLNLAEVIALSRRLDLPFPERILLIGIEVGDVGKFGDRLDPDLEKRLEDIHTAVRDAAAEFLKDPTE